VFYKYALAALAVTIPTGALAQTVTTDCYSHKSRVHCTSSVRPSFDQLLGDIAAARLARDNEKVYAEGRRILAERARLGIKDPDPLDVQRWRITTLIGNGDCAGAQAYAKANKTATTIARVAEFCGPATP